MKDLTPKINNSTTAQGKLTAEEFNDMRSDAQNVVVESGQTLTESVSEDNRQLMKGVAIGGKRISRGNGETAEVGEIILPENSSGFVTIILPSLGNLFVNATVDFEQVIGQPYSTHSLIIDRNGQLIMSLDENLILDTMNSNESKIRFNWLGGTVGWSISVLSNAGFTTTPPAI